MKFLSAVFLSALIVLFAHKESLASPNYIDAKPLHHVVKTPVGEVKGGTVLLPLITWGGDIATIYGNGNQRSTANGSIFAQHGVKVKLQREDVFTKQLERYISGETPYLRGTLGMINAASDLLNKDPRTKPVIIYQLTWSAGGDALVVKPNIKTAKDLKGKTIAIQAYGPHVDYLAKVLLDAGLSLSDVNIKWLADLTGTENSPMNALFESDVDAAFVIIPDALALTSGGNVGTGAEDSVEGAKILLSTKTANRVIADVYAVRSDYFKIHKAGISQLVSSLMKSEEGLAQALKKRSGGEYKKIMTSAADILLDSPQAISDAEGLYADAEFVGYSGNVEFFTDKNHPRNFKKLNAEIQNSYKAVGITSGVSTLTSAGWSFASLKQGLKNTTSTQVSRFNPEAVASVVTRKQQQGTLKEGELFSFEVYFKPNQNTFDASLYEDAFNRVVNLSKTYGGAVITVEGHSDPMGYLRKKKSGETAIVLGQIKQSAKNLSLGRSQQVRDSLIDYAKRKNINLDSGQFAVIGHGISQPGTGICGQDPCPPKTEQEWLSNMRVEFRIIQVEAESSVFKPL